MVIYFGKKTKTMMVGKLLLMIPIILGNQNTRETPANIRIDLILPESRDIELHLRR